MFSRLRTFWAEHILVLIICMCLNFRFLDFQVPRFPDSWAWACAVSDPQHLASSAWPIFTFGSGDAFCTVITILSETMFIIMFLGVCLDVLWARWGLDMILSQ